MHRLLALSLVVGLAAAACSTSDADQVPEVLHVELVSEGDDDLRVTLAPSPALGSEHTIRMVAQRAVAFPDQDASFEVTSPRSETTSRIEIVDQPDGGGFTIEGTVIEARALDQGELDAHNLIRFNRGLDALAGSPVSASVDANGVVERSDLDLPADLSPVVRDAILDLGTLAEIAVVPVPAGDVGVGAIWVDTMMESFRSLDATTRTTYELTEIDGERYLLDVGYEQVFEGSTTESGVELTYTGVVSGGGVVEGDTTRPTPISHRLTAAGSVSVSDGAQTVELTIDLFVSVSTS